MKAKFRNFRLAAKNVKQLDLVNEIIEEYQEQGYRLSLRQLYYQLVSRDVIPNEAKEYAKLSKLLVEGRMSGIVDWDAIEDRVRIPSKPTGWDSPKQILNGALNQYRRDRMQGQECYIEVWVEKDALSGVLKRVTQEYGINILVNRGYSSVSAMYDSYERIKEALTSWRNPASSARILYLGDFDPSGQDMIRDIYDRLTEFYSGDEEWPEDNGFDMDIVSVALTMEQIKAYGPPPNPAKISDPRADKFIAEHGSSSWEVDALKPEVLNSILKESIESLYDADKYNAQVEQERTEKDVLRQFIKTL